MNGLRSIFEKESRDEKVGVRMSAAGHCGRQQAYRYHGTKGLPLSWRAMSIFSDGDYIQDQIRQWIHLSPKPECYYLADEELEVELKTPKGRCIKGHVDGIIYHKAELLGVPVCEDPTHTTRLLEIKSMSSRGFKALEYQGLERSYLCQVACYLSALGLSECVVIAKCKDTSELKEITVRTDEGLTKECLDRFDSIIDSKQPNDVQRMYGPKEDGSLPWQCGYCPYWQTCWANFTPVAKQQHKIQLTGDYKEVR